MTYCTYLIQWWCSLQSCISLSSGEAELTAAIKGASEGLNMKNLLDEFNHSTDLKCYMDSSAARGICHRVGVGKLKHLEVKDLWLQEKTQAKQLSVQWIPRKSNPSDFLTHPITKSTEIQNFHEAAGLHIGNASPRARRPSLALGRLP